MQPENLEPRVSALEGQVGESRGDVQANKVEVAAVRDLARAVDRDVSEMRGFRRVDERFTQVNNGFAEMRGKFDITAAGQQRIVELIRQAFDTPGGTAPA